MDQYLGYWLTQYPDGFGASHFCFRIADGKIGQKPLWGIKDKNIVNIVTMIGDGNRIKDEKTDGTVGVYHPRERLITWQKKFVWVRPGKQMFVKPFSYSTQQKCIVNLLVFHCIIFNIHDF